MSDYQLLYLILLLLYLTDCSLWVTNGCIAFVGRWGVWQPLLSPALFGNARGGVALAWPFPLGKPTYLAATLPFSWSLEGICNHSLEEVGERVPPAAPLRFIPFNEIGPIETRGKILRVNDLPFVTCITWQQAEAGAALLRQLVTTKGTPGNNLLSPLFSLSSIAEQKQRCTGQIRILRWLCLLQFLLIFILGPISVFLFGPLALIMAAAVIILLNLLVIVLSWRAHATLYPDRLGERVSDSLATFFFPPRGVRATDFLAQPLLSGFHPLAVGQSLLEEETFRTMAGRHLALLRHPRLSSLPPALQQGLLYHAGTMAEVVEEFFRSVGIEPAILSSPPRPQGARSFCPRCLSTFTQQEGECPECGDIPLTPYAPHS
ncbi:MAG TPA: hypothetical protein VFR01_06440 [Geobacterales bacterium]|nr:hypothetical protein [Geobacterales bacterium]